VLATIEEWTTTPQTSCPWRAFDSDLVRDVIESFGWFESGQIETYRPDASHRLIEGLGFYKRVTERVRGKVREQEAAERERQRKQEEATRGHR